MGSAFEEPAIPESVGPYRIEEKLGAGGMGVVYRASHWVTGQQVALKTVKVPNESHLASIRREIRALARIRHPGVVRILAEGVQDGLPWCAMELLEGKTLRQILRESMRARALTDPAALRPTIVYRPTDADPARAQTEVFDRTVVSSDSAAEDLFQGVSGIAHEVTEKLTLVRRLCAPLAYLHGEGIVHCDLKPDNILIRPDGQPVLVDFGLMTLFAGRVSRETLDPRQQIVGTAWYMAPEQVSGELFDARVDLYALGCILYELMVGQPPFVGRTAYEVLAQHYTASAPPPSRLTQGLPPDIDALVARLLEKRPQDRIGHADDVAAALAAMGAGNGITATGPSARPYLYRPGFSGREETMHELGRHLRRSKTGFGALLLVGGESGVGKTRLALALADEARRIQMSVLSQECPPPSISRESGPVNVGGPLRGFAKMLELVADRCRDRGPTEVERLLGEGGRRGAVLKAYAPGLAGLGEIGKAEDLPPDAARLRLLTYLTQTIRELVDGEPTLLIIDDLQWADELTIDALCHLVKSRFLDEHPIVVLATHRTDDEGAELSDLRALSTIRTITLGRLDESAVSSQVRDMLAMDPVPPELAAFLARQSEGNPFFVAEYLRTAVSEGLIARDSQGRWRTGGGDSRWESLSLPGSIRELVSRRLGWLRSAARKVLEMAAVLGREIDHDLLARAMDVDEAALGEVIEELIVHQILEEPSGSLRFVHGRIREVAYDEIDEASRRTLHRRAALVLETGPKPREEILAILGRHWEEALEMERARDCYLLAARHASKQFRNHEAERLYRACLCLTPERSIEHVAARYKLCKDVLIATGKNQAARDEARAALVIALELCDPKSIALAKSALGSALHVLDSPEEALHLHEEAARIFQDLGFRKAHTREVHSQALCQQFLGHMDEAGRLLEQAGALARESGRLDQEALTMTHLAALSTELGRTEVARELYERCLPMFRAMGDLRHEAVAVANYALLLQEVGEMDLAIKHHLEALELDRRIGARLAESVTTGNLAICVEQQGRLEEARTLYEKALAIHREVGARRHEGITLNNLATLHHALGKLEVAGALLDQAMTIHRDLGNRRSEGITHSNVGHLRIDLGDLRGARGAFEEALAIHEEVDDATGVGSVLFNIARVDRLAGRNLVEGLRSIDRSEVILRRCDQKIELLQCLCERGHHHLALGRSARAELAEAEQLAKVLRVNAGGSAGRCVAVLAAAVAAFAEGRPLTHGEVEAPPS